MIQALLHNVLLDVGSVKEKIREQTWEVSLPFQKAEVVPSAHQFGVILLSFLPSGVVAVKFFVLGWVWLQK